MNKNLIHNLAITLGSLSLLILPLRSHAQKPESGASNETEWSCAIAPKPYKLQAFSSEAIFYSLAGAMLALAIVNTCQRFPIRLKKKKETSRKPIQSLPQAIIIAEPTDNEPPIPEPTKNTENLLWLKIDKTMVEQELWRDPDLTASAMIDRMNTNRTSFSKAIRHGGYDNFNNYLAHYRIQAFCKQAETEKIENIQDAFFNVSYKARTTAFTQFKRIKGVSPSKYIDHLNRKL